MSFYFPNVDYTYIFKREGTEDDPFLSLEDTNNVSKGAIILREVPSPKDEISIVDANGNGLTETDSDEPSNSQFRVDYSVGSVHFNSSRNGDRMTISYLGMGWVFISAARVMMMGEEDDPLQSLEELLESVAEGVETLEQVGNLEFMDEYSDTKEYKKWNFVTYRGKTFVATRSSTGISPDNNSHWKLVSSGVGFSGVYDEDATYTVGDMVSDTDKKNLYVSKKVDNDSTLDNEDDWELMLTLDDSVQNMMNTIKNKMEDLNELEEDIRQNDSDRDDKEDERDGQFTDVLAQLELFKQDIKDDEEEREANESSRKSEESVRKSGEESRVSSEAERRTNERERINQEEAREQNTNASIEDIQGKITEFDSLSQSVSNSLTEIEIVKNDADTILGDTEAAINDLGGFTHAHEYDESKDYDMYNIVEHKGSSYIAIQDVVQPEDGEDEDVITLDNKEYWGILALKGRDISELSIDGISPDEDGFISLEPLGLASENLVQDTKTEIMEDYNEIIGDLSNLNTTRKGNIIEAINELKRKMDDIIDLID